MTNRNSTDASKKIAAGVCGILIGALAWRRASGVNLWGSTCLL
ncbi:hypothetical protein [Coleofasciculus sp. H7-2]